jgi:N-acylneuraminate cytidylyltransferase
MRILALIPARGGSKRIPGKNFRPLGGRPLITWTIDVAMKIPEVCDILVSTDDASIADIAQGAGALVPWLRPAELATDTAISVDVALHALDWYEREKGAVDGLLLLQPTSPFRSLEVVLRGLEIFRLNRECAVIGVSPAKTHPMWCFKMEGGVLHPFMDAVDGFSARSQDLSPVYEVNGAFYLLSPQNVRNHHSFFTANMLALELINPIEAIDIDTEWDWLVAEAVLLRYKSVNGKNENPCCG